jgi:hypothetical protein
MEILLVSPPKDFQVGFSAPHGNGSIAEYVPVGQTVDDWSEMLTVQYWRHATVDPATFLQGVAGRYANHCPGTGVDKAGIHTGPVNGYVASMMLLRCPNNPATGKPDTTAFRVIKGNDALYSVQYAWPSVPSDEKIKYAMQYLAQVIVCDPRTQDHPCPALDPLKPSN